MDYDKPAKDGGDKLDVSDVRKKYQACTENELALRQEAVEDIKFVNVPGAQWEEAQKKKRGTRPCYEFNLLRQHCRQVTGDQRQARPSIKVRAVEDDDAEGAELRQGLIRNIEAQSNAERAYDTGFQFAAEGGFGCWRVVTEYSADDAWEQDIRIKEVRDPFAVWFDPAAVEYDRRDAQFAFFEQNIPKTQFKAKHPDAICDDFDSAQNYGDWFQKDTVRIAEYWVKKPVKKTLLLLSDGRSVDADEIAPALDELEAQGITVKREREVQTHKVCMYVVSGAEVLSGPHEWPGKFIPLVPVYGDLIHIDGRDTYSGIVRHAKDAQRLANYQNTTALESIAKLPKVPYLVTPDMLAGKGVKETWERAATEDPLFLAYTPDPKAPGNRPVREAQPEFPVAMVQMGQICNDLLKSVTGIHDASLGARSNETSGKAIIARQREGDTATFSYQDNLARSIRYTGEILLDLIPKVYDTERVIRIIGMDGGEKFQKINAEVPDQQTGQMIKVNDLSAGKYDVTVTTGPSFSTQRAEFVELMNTLFQGNPQTFQLFGDLFFKAMDMPQAQELSERAKLMLPPQLQKQQGEGKEMPPEVMMAMQQAQEAMQQAQQQLQALQQAAQELQQDKAATDADKAQTAAQKAQIAADIKVAQAEFDKREAEFQAMEARFEAHVAKTDASFTKREAAIRQPQEQETPPQ
jgi:hypothetical protein